MVTAFFDSVFSPIIASFADKENSKPPRTILPVQDIHDQHDYWEDWLSRNIDELAAKETTRYLKQIEPMLAKSPVESIAAVPWRVGVGIQQLIQAGWREMWYIGASDAVRELNTVNRKVAKSKKKANFAEDDYSTLEEKDPFSAATVKRKSDPFMVVYPPNYGMPLTRSVLRGAVAQRGVAVARSYEGSVQAQIIKSIAKSVERHRSNTGMPELAKRQLFDEIRAAVDPRGVKNYKDAEKSEEMTSKDVSDRYFRASAAARRVASTELSAAYSLGRLNTYIQAGVNKVRWVNLDRGACKICGDRNGMIFNIDELLAQGENRFDATQYILPAHPHCRCHYEPVTDVDEDDREDEKNPKNNPALTTAAAIAGAWTMKEGLKAAVRAGVGVVGAAVQSQREAQMAERARRAKFIQALAVGAAGAMALGGLYMLLNEFRKKVDNSEEQVGSAIPGLVSNTTQYLESEAVRNATDYLREKTAETQAATNAGRIPARPEDILSEQLRQQPAFARLIAANPNLNTLTPTQLQKVYGLTEWQVQLLKKEVESFKKRMAAPLWMEASPQKILPDSLRRIYPWLNNYPDLRVFSLEEAIQRTGSQAKGEALIDYIQRQLRVMQALPVPGTYEVGGVGADRLQREDWLALLPPGSTNKEQIIQNIMQMVGSSRPSTREELVSLLRKAGLSEKAAQRAASAGTLAPSNINAELAEWQGTVDKAARKIMDRSGVSRKVARAIVLTYKKSGSWQGMEDLRNRLTAEGTVIDNKTFDALVRAFVANIEPLPDGVSGAMLPLTIPLRELLVEGEVSALPAAKTPKTLQEMIEANNAQTPGRNIGQDYISSQLMGQTSALLEQQKQQAAKINPSNLAGQVSSLLGEAAVTALSPVNSILEEAGRRSQRDLKGAQVRAVLPIRIQEALAAKERVLQQAADLKEEIQERVLRTAASAQGSRLNVRPVEVKAKAAINVARKQIPIAERLSQLATNTGDSVAELAAKVEKVKAQYAEAIGGQGEGLVPVDVLSSAYQKDLAQLNGEIAAVDKTIKDSFTPGVAGGRSAAQARLAEMTVKRDELISLRDSVVNKYQQIATSPEVLGRLAELRANLGEVGSDFNLATLGLTEQELAKLGPSTLKEIQDQIRPIEARIQESVRNQFGIMTTDSIPLVANIQAQLRDTEKAIALLQNASQPDVVARLANSRAQLKAMLNDLKKLPKKKAELSPLQAKRHKQTFGDAKQRNAALKKVGDPLDNLRQLSDSEKARVNPNAETVLDKFRPRADGTTLFEEELSGIERSTSMGLEARQKAIDKNLALLNLISGPEGADYVFRNTKRVISMIDDPEVVAGLGASAKEVVGLESAAAFRRRIYKAIRDRLDREVVVNGVTTRVGAIPDMEKLLDYDMKTQNLSPLLKKTDTALAQEIQNQQAGLKAFDDYEKAIEKGLEGVRRPDGTIQSVGLRDAHLEYYLGTAPEIRNEIRRRRNEYLTSSSRLIGQLQEAKKILEAEVVKPMKFGTGLITVEEVKQKLLKTSTVIKSSGLASKERGTIVGLAHKGLLTSRNQKDSLRIVNKYLSGDKLTDAEQQFLSQWTQEEIEAAALAQRNGGIEMLFARNAAIGEVTRLEIVRSQVWSKVLQKVEKIRKDTGFQIEISVTEDTAPGLTFPARVTISNPQYVDNPDRFRGGIAAAEARLAKPMAELRGLLGVDEMSGAANISEKSYLGVRTLLQRSRSELESIELRMETIGFSRSERLSKFLTRQALATFRKPHDSRNPISRFAHGSSPRPQFTASGRRLLPRLDKRNWHR